MPRQQGSSSWGSESDIRNSLTFSHRSEVRTFVFPAAAFPFYPIQQADTQVANT